MILIIPTKAEIEKITGLQYQPTNDEMAVATAKILAVSPEGNDQLLKTTFSFSSFDNSCLRMSRGLGLRTIGLIVEIPIATNNKAIIDIVMPLMRDVVTNHRDNSQRGARVFPKRGKAR